MTNAGIDRKAARVFGFFFIATFLSYGVGSGLVESVTSQPDFLAEISAHRTRIVLGAILMAIVHTFLNIGLPIIMLPILMPFNRRLTYGYLSAAIIATAILAVGALFLLMLIPLGAEAGSATAHDLELIGGVLKAGANSAYHMGMALWSLGGLMFCTVLFQSRLLPRFMSVWGAIGYVVLFAGSLMELFGHNDFVEFASVVPGGLFELTLSVWLIFKGFSHSELSAERTGEHTRV